MVGPGVLFIGPFRPKPTQSFMSKPTGYMDWRETMPDHSCSALDRVEKFIRDTVPRSGARNDVLRDLETARDINAHLRVAAKSLAWAMFSEGDSRPMGGPDGTEG